MMHLCRMPGPVRRRRLQFRRVQGYGEESKGHQKLFEHDNQFRNGLHGCGTR